MNSIRVHYYIYTTEACTQGSGSRLIPREAKSSRTIMVIQPRVPSRRLLVPMYTRYGEEVKSDTLICLFVVLVVCATYAASNFVVVCNYGVTTVLHCVLAASSFHSVPGVELVCVQHSKHHHLHSEAVSSDQAKWVFECNPFDLLDTVTLCSIHT